MSSTFVTQELLDRHKADTGHGTRGPGSTGRPRVNVGSFYCEPCMKYFHESAEFTKHYQETHPELEQPSQVPEEDVLISNDTPTTHNPALVQCTQDAAGNSFLDRIDPSQTNKRTLYADSGMDPQSKPTIDSQIMEQDSTSPDENMASITGSSTNSDILTNCGSGSTPFTQNNVLLCSELFPDTYTNINSYNINDTNDLVSFISGNDMAEPVKTQSKSGLRKKEKKQKQSKAVGEQDEGKVESRNRMEITGDKKFLTPQKDSLLQGNSEYQITEQTTSMPARYQIGENWFLTQGVKRHEEACLRNDTKSEIMIPKCKIKEEPSWKREEQVTEDHRLEGETEFLEDSQTTIGYNLDEESKEFFKQTEDLSKRRHKCLMCLKAFKRSHHLKRHLKTHEKKGHVSDVCELQEFTANLKQEDFPQQIQVPSKPTVLSDSLITSDPTVDSEQDDFFKETEHLKQRMEKDKHFFKCMSCVEMFNTQDDLSSHVEHVHVEKGNQKFLCKICGHVSKVKSALERHMIIHSGEKPFICQKCNQSFTRKVNLSDHIRIVHEGRCLKCNLCSKSFTARRTYTWHLSLHAKDIIDENGERRKSSCPVCDRQFDTKSSFDRHVASHNAESQKSKFLCGICGRACERRRELERHMYQHTGEKPFLCSQCPESFTRYVSV